MRDPYREDWLIEWADGDPANLKRMLDGLIGVGDWRLARSAMIALERLGMEGKGS